MTYMRRHMSINLSGMLRNYEHESMKGLLLDDNGKELSDKQCRQYIAQCQSKGWKVIPMCDEKECPGFDYFGGGCPGHEITKEEYKNSNL